MSCPIANYQCEYNTRYRCYACGEYVCGGCSAIRPWVSYRVNGGWKKRPHRICDNCQEEGNWWEEEEEELS